MGISSVNSVSWANVASVNSVAKANIASVYSVAAGDILSGYSVFGTVTVDNTKVVGASDFTNFKVPIAGSYSYLASTGNGGSVQSSGNDILFTDITGGTILDFERRYYDDTGSVRFWVSVPTLYAGTDTQFRIYVGKASESDRSNTNAVWSDYYSAVYSLEENPSGSAPQAIDLTGHGYSMTSAGTMTSGDLINGPLGSAIDFDGSNDYYAYGSAFSTSGSGAVEMWCKFYGTTPGPTLFSSSDQATTDYYMRSTQFNGYIYTNQKSGGASTTNRTDTQLGTGAWHHVFVQSDGSAYSIVVNGTVQSIVVIGGANNGNWFGDTANRDNMSIAVTLRSSPYDLALAAYSDVRFTDNVPGTAYAVTEYNSQSSPSTFYSITI